MQIQGPTGVFTADGPVAAYWLAQPGYSQVAEPAQVAQLESAAQAVAGELTGPHLEAALRQLDLPSTGSADQKRAAVADALATRGIDPTPVTDDTPEV